MRLRKNQVIQTQHFGLYREDKDNAMPVEEVQGMVRVHSLNGQPAAFLYHTIDKDNYMRYDLPLWCDKFNNKKVWCLGRPVVKTVGDKQYHKLVVIRIKEHKDVPD